MANEQRPRISRHSASCRISSTSHRLRNNSAYARGVAEDNKSDAPATAAAAGVCAFVAAGKNRCGYVCSKCARGKEHGRQKTPKTAAAERTALGCARSPRVACRPAAFKPHQNLHKRRSLCRCSRAPMTETFLWGTQTLAVEPPTPPPPALNNSIKTTSR